MTSNKELSYEIPHLLRVYKDGTIDRLTLSPYVPPSLHDPITGISSKDVVISPTVSARLYLPKLTHPTKLPILVYMHGGGFILGSAFTLPEHNYLKTVVCHTNTIVISVEYRLAPENPLPAAYEDCWTAIQWVASHSTSVNHDHDLDDDHDDGEESHDQEAWLVECGDYDRMYVGGDGSGANIVHNLVMRSKEGGLKNGVRISGVFLGCPYFLGPKATSGDESLAYKFWMLANPGGVDDVLINSFRDDGFVADFESRKVLVVVAEKDGTREFGVKYYEAVKGSEWDGEVEILEVEGEGHCFYVVESSSEKAKIVMNKLASFIV